eukprot:CAMPEP_0202891636 /NCGR_PEP_ID=MMETSP1392-20130828/1649_1 /ASSEMBLY_ACC=CAM_ASM_000868 /TAXON_ID=225041 /ORGANISM="Chlamydomonas chlamydogama, Strain SAG 11-48b" /LENGTH=75 /DNA_ID=CAMNT_0049575449 /DNA_START=36 /DNA_END=263 /DNA_ORIENTATION=-
MGLAELVTTAPERAWQRNLIRAIRLKFPKPPTSSGVEPLLRAAAGMEEDQAMPDSAWLRAMIKELKAQWGFARTM